MTTYDAAPLDERGFRLPVVQPAHWLLRLPAAATFITHGIGKLPNLPAGAEYMGLPLLIWTLVALGEIGSGLAVLAGPFLGRFGDMLTRLGGAGMAVIMVGAVAMVHWGQWSMTPTETHPAGGMEFQVLLLGLGLVLALRGNRS